MKPKILSSLLWKLLERAGTQGVQFLVQIFLARILAPEMFGSIAILMVFINLAQVFVQSGLSTALIQKKEVDGIDYSSVLIISLVLATAVYLLFYILAPLISDYYNDTSLSAMLRILALTLFSGAINSVQTAFISRNMLFKELFKRSIIAILISGSAGIAAGYAGLGIWALVIQQLTNQAAITVILWFTLDWRPTWEFSFIRVKSLFSFGYKLLLSSVIDALYRDLRTLIIGHMYSPAMLGHYNKGEQFPKLIVSSINGSIQSVMLPVLSSYQDDRSKVKDIMRRTIIVSSFLLFPIMIGLAVTATPLVRIILTEKWLPAVPYLQIACFSYILWPIHTANLQAINSLGRSDIFLKLEIVKKIIGVLVLLISVPVGIMAIAIGNTVSGVISSFVNAYPNRKLLQYGYSEQIKDVLPTLRNSLIMGGVTYSIFLLNLSDWLTLLIQVVTAIFVYVFISIMMKSEGLSYLKMIIKRK